MILNFEQMETTALKHFYGGEGTLSAELFQDGQNKILFGRLEPGASIGLHTHETSSEIIYFLRGEGRALCDGGSEPVRAGLCHYCPKGHSHSLINDGAGPLEFFAVVPQQ